MRTVFVCLAALIGLLVGFPVQAQTVPDWTKTDCDGNSHSLYSELDSGCVVIMDVAMDYMNRPTNTVICPSCSTATAALSKLDDQYKTSHPGKVRHYVLAYASDYTCDEMAQWKTKCGFSVPTITDCAEVTNAAGQGMPLIIVIGPDHTVLSKITSWGSDHSAALKTAIDKGLAQGSASVHQSSLSSRSVRITEAGGRRNLELDLQQSESVTIDVMDLMGKCCAAPAASIVLSQGHHSIPISTTGLPSGSYIVRVAAHGGDVVSVPFQITR